jgi:hypothetical protein
MAALPREAGFAPILLHEGASQTSLRLIPPAAGLRFPDLSRHSPTLLERRRRIGLRLTLEPDLRF